MIGSRTFILILLVLIGLIPMRAAMANTGVHLGQSQLADIRDIHGDKVYFRVLLWQALIKDNQKQPDLVKLRLVNNFFNDIPYKKDEKLWGKKNFWATPLDILIKNGADCEDYALAKYFTLIGMGMPRAKLRLTFVKSSRIKESHMVLSYYETPSADPFVLDNMTHLILYGTERPDLKPIYSFNGDGLWFTNGSMASGSSSAKPVGKKNQTALWDDLQTRMYQQGLR